jgi:hypothetical protein
LLSAAVVVVVGLNPEELVEQEVVVALEFHI